jgi:predicted molibdopterin-dependent oxidoreductase YjgC
MKLFGRGRMPLDDDTGIVRGEALIVDLQGKPVKAYAGETVAAVVVAADGLATRTTVSGERRGIFCGMGVCFDCLVVVNGVPNTRSCMTLVTNGMKIQYQERAGLDH